MIKLELNNIEFSFENILKIKSVAFHEDKLNILKGKNASGKTTILKVIAGYSIPKTGSLHVSDPHIKVNFDDFNMKEQKKYNKFIKNNVSFIESTSIFYNDSSIKQNLEYFLRINGQKYTSEKLDSFINLMNYFEIEEKLYKNISSLSKGTQQKLLVIFQLLLNRKIILFDEPTLGFDKSSVLKFFELLKNLEKTFIITTHESNYEMISSINEIYMEEILT
ncbi:ATP-binding cassette domain-containing protein [Exiguobacterium sp. R-17]|uniref:ATP-binding cassette domain-containing protein n=1 Tax=Exiguobacterium sp. R-17 TaxID=3404054 RepID=UPI003CEC98EE